MEKQTHTTYQSDDSCGEIIKTLFGKLNWAYKFGTQRLK